MVFRSLQRRIVVVFIGLLTLVMALVLALVANRSQSIVAAQMQRELDAGARIFQQLVEQKRTQLETTAAVLSADFGFREAIATQDKATIASVLQNHGSRIGAKVMLAIGLDGRAIAGTREGEQPFPELLQQAIEHGKRAGFRKLADGKLYQIVIVPILAPRQIAWVAMGFPVDDIWAHDLAVTTGLAVSVMAVSNEATQVLASSLASDQRTALESDRGAGGRVLDGEALTLQLGDAHYRTLSLPIERNLVVVLQRAQEQVQAPFNALLIALVTIVLGGMVLFCIGSYLLARHIAGPVNTLAMEARRIAAGDYAQPVRDLPPDEIGQLARSFDQMREGIAAREQKILKLAYEDALTGLPNRTRLLQEFDARSSQHGAMAVLDLDRFALINDALGHPVGDRLLTEVAARLARIVPPGVLLARLWGDEFALLIPEADERVGSALAERLLAGLRVPILIDGQRLDVGGSFGLSFYPRDGNDVSTLLRRAELAMYAAKKKQVGVMLSEAVEHDPPHEQLSLIGEMRDALARDEFVIYYQPKLDLASHQIIGAEALLRWQHPTRGMVPPGMFIPFAEQTGFIREITPWLLNRVAGQAAAWRHAGLILSPSVNLSALDLLSPVLVGQVQHLVRAHRLPPESLCLEITESALMEDPALALAHLDDLADSGFKLSIDDYGAGQASLAYLKNLPVHELKIDQIFVTHLTTSPKDAAIVRSTIGLGHALGLKVVAEGAETNAELDWLRDAGCDIAQGYGIARPMPATQVAGWVAARVAV
ncbi:putative bifunctional diguanylate cyclase/phosphodiesterase [Andreprevotia chitinilytica]|uniref:putative bifunctional diguanylate cyclase/phosphodiesterase n=1 Tax=Andreprevotia chitinilytica TaxID=396808 RepID=UPI00069019A0|nr:EAL domain-containing protein [Andreprevotia chitinilytica]